MTTATGSNSDTEIAAAMERAELTKPEWIDLSRVGLAVLDPRTGAGMPITKDIFDEMVETFDAAKFTPPWREAPSHQGKNNAPTAPEHSRAKGFITAGLELREQDGKIHLYGNTAWNPDGAELHASRSYSSRSIEGQRHLQPDGSKKWVLTGVVFTNYAAIDGLAAAQAEQIAGAYTMPAKTFQALHEMAGLDAEAIAAELGVDAEALAAGELTDEQALQYAQIIGSALAKQGAAETEAAAETAAATEAAQETQMAAARTENLELARRIDSLETAQKTTDGELALAKEQAQGQRDMRVSEMRDRLVTDGRMTPIEAKGDFVDFALSRTAPEVEGKTCADARYEQGLAPYMEANGFPAGRIKLAPGIRSAQGAHDPKGSLQMSQGEADGKVAELIKEDNASGKPKWNGSPSAFLRDAPGTEHEALALAYQGAEQ